MQPDCVRRLHGPPGRRVKLVGEARGCPTLPPGQNACPQLLRVLWAQADLHSIPKVENSNVDQSVGLIHIALTGWVRAFCGCGGVLLAAGRPLLRETPGGSVLPVFGVQACCLCFLGRRAVFWGQSCCLRFFWVLWWHYRRRATVWV